MNWEQRIQRANKIHEANQKNKTDKKCFTDDDIKLCVLWTTGPISEVADKVELREGKLELGPTDIYLVMDGIYFTKGVEDDNVGLATFCFNNIVKQTKALVAGTDKITRLKQFLGEYY